MTSITGVLESFIIKFSVHTYDQHAELMKLLSESYARILGLSRLYNGQMNA
jgi:hypothetical protein